MKKIIFIVSMVVSFSAYADCNDQNCVWECGEHCTATLDKTTNTLNIKGYGAMYNYDNENNKAPWRDYADSVKKIAFQNESESLKLTSVGDNAFHSMWANKEVVLSEGIQTLGYGSFYSNTGLENMNIPTTLENIGSWNYAGSQISSIEIPDTVQTIPWAAFQESNAEKIIIPDSITTLPEHTFLACPYLKTVVLGENVQEIFLDSGTGHDVFEHTPLLENVYCKANNQQVCTDVLLASGKTAEQVAAMLKTYTKDENGMYRTSDGQYFASKNDMSYGVDYSCGATTSICATVLSEVGGANCDTIKSCRNLAEMADANEYCNSMSTCKELTDMVASETYCDSLESCKALSDMAASGEYCTTVAECKALNDMVGGENCDSLESCKALSDMAASGEYCTTVAECKALNDMVGGENCDSLESCKALSDMAASGEYCTTVAECKRFMDLMNSGYCEGFATCKEMFNASVINYDGKRYGSLEDLYNGNALPSITRQEQGDGSFAVYKDGVFVGYKGKRIYTMEEANRVTKPTGNTFKIKYR